MGQYIGFKLGSEEFAVPILLVQEIMKIEPATKIPQSPDYILGVINLRGRTIPILDLRKRLDIYGAVDAEDSRIIVMNLGQIVFGGVVDSISGVVDISEDKIENNLELIESKADESVRGVANLDNDRMILFLEFSKLLSIEDLSLLTDKVISSEVNEEGQTVVTKKIAGRGGEVYVKEVTEALEHDAKEKGLGVEEVNILMEEVQKLLDAFTTGKIEEAEKALSTISSLGEREIFSEVGTLTRRLHNSLVEFKTLIDPKLKNMAEDDMPDAADKLEWVISKTDEAASKTLGLVEKSQTLQEELVEKFKVLEQKFEKIDDLTDLERESFSFVKEGLSELGNGFIDIMLAQEFQDLTGQILKKVISLVADLETQLVGLVKVFGLKVETKRPQAETVKSGEIELKGPAIKEEEGVLAKQDDVDSLLAEFGF